MSMKRFIWLLAVAGIALTHGSVSAQQPQIPVRKLSSDREKLQVEAAITTISQEELNKIPVTAEVEHDSEVARTEVVTVVVMAFGCQTNADKRCDATADVVVYKPDGSIHSELKNISLASHRGTALLKLTSDDVTGVYKIVATVRDPQAQRFAKAERLFGVK